jgi:ferric-dicitrate binding protein FerR (iron transport regulator)
MLAAPHIYEAIFDVKSQNGKPFYVHTAHYKIKVLGTNFDVSAYTNEEQSRVTLLKGKVEISPDFTSQKTILSPGESFLCQPKDSTFQKIQIPVGSVYAWREKTVIFDGHTLEDKRGELYRHYGYQFLLSSSAKKLKYKATLRDESLDEFLSTLKFLSPGIRYRINHEQKKIWITDYKDE